jgi:hypothetical protein
MICDTLRNVICDGSRGVQVIQVTKLMSILGYSILGYSILGYSILKYSDTLYSDTLNFIQLYSDTIIL